MKTSIAALIVATLIGASGAWAQAPASAPAGSTGLCKDGTYHNGATKSGACSGRKGVKDWYGAVAAPAALAPATPAPVPGMQKDRVGAAPSTPASPAGRAAQRTPVAGGGRGQVWVNTKSKAYHCQGTLWYGRTLKGEYMTEAAAKTAGYHHKNGCS